MVVEFSTFGSCTSRNIFYGNVNPGYKEFFHINDSVELVSIISLMSKPVSFDKTLINSSIDFDNECALNNLSKSFLNFLKINSHIEYLLIDTYFDVECRCIVLDKDTYITDSGRLSRTDYYKQITNKRRIDIFNNYNEYMELWRKSCDSFFDFLDKNCSNIKIVLNCSRGAYYYLNDDNEKVKFDNFKHIYESNKLRDILDTYILENFDVDVLPFDDSTFANKNHVFRLHTVHYEDKYYKEKTKQLNEIIERNNILNYHDSYNVNYRKIQKENVIIKFKENNDWLNMEYEPNGIYDNLNKYNTARIDIKNSGISSNNVLVIDSSDSDMLQGYPLWFEKEYGEGKGIVIESQKNFLDLTIKCMGNGDLNLILRSIDFKIKGKRIPIYIKYTKCMVNGINIIDEDIFVSCDEPFNFKLPVKHGDYVTLKLFWEPLN